MKVYEEDGTQIRTESKFNELKKIQRTTKTVKIFWIKDWVLVPHEIQWLVVIDWEEYNTKQSKWGITIYYK